MNKILRFSFISLLMMLCGSIYAQTNIWTEDWTGWEPKTDPAGVNPNYTFTGTVFNDDNSYKSGTAVYNEKLAGGEAPELMLAKSGGSFTAKIPLNGASGTITLAVKSNNGKFAVTAEGATVGDVTKSGNDYSYPITINSGATEISITFTTNTSSNVRVDDFKLYSGESKKPAGLSFGTSSRTVTIGAEDNSFPTLTNANNLPVTYSSSDESVATIDSNGEITLNAAGKTVIKAEFTGNDEYEAGYAEYTLTVKEAVAPATEELTVAEALEKINALGTESTSYVDNKAAFNVKGYIVEITEMSIDHGNATFTIADSKGGSPVLIVYRCKDLENKNFTEENKIKVGDQVVVTGALQMYVKNGVGTPEVSGPSGGPSCYLISITSDVTSVPVPTISGTTEFTDKTTVTITCSDEDAVIYYTIDGSDPKSSSTTQTYSGPFELTETATVKAYAEDVEGNTSDVNEKTFTKQEAAQTEKAADIAALKALDKGTNAELTLTDAQVLYAWKSNNGNIQAYVRDASGAMCFDFRGDYAAAGEQFETNKIVNGTIMVTNSVYNGLPQASAYADTNDENLTFNDGSEAQAVSTTIPNVKNYICDLVEIEIDKIVSDEAEKPKYYAKSGDDQIQIYNQFHVAAYEDLSKLVGSATTIKGIAVIYQTKSMEEPIYEIYPIADGIVTGISEVNMNAVNDGKIYNLAGQKVNKNYKGIIIMNGKKMIQK